MYAGSILTPCFLSMCADNSAGETSPISARASRKRSIGFMRILQRVVGTCDVSAGDGMILNGGIVLALRSHVQNGRLGVALLQRFPLRSVVFDEQRHDWIRYFYYSVVSPRNRQRERFPPSFYAILRACGFAC